MTDLLEFWGSKLDQIEGMTAAYSCNQQLYSFILTSFDLHKPGAWATAPLPPVSMKNARERVH
jgi:hypothetical protein